MTIDELNIQLKKLGIPIAYGVFSEKQIPPYITYFRHNDEAVYADDTVYTKSPHIVLELYCKKRNMQLETAIEKLLTVNEIPYEVYEEYLSDEKLRMITYEFNL